MSIERCFTLTAVMHGTKARAGSGDVANCIALLVCKRTVSKFTSVLQPDSRSHNLILESDPEIGKQRKRTVLTWNGKKVVHFHC